MIDKPLEPNDAWLVSWLIANAPWLFAGILAAVVVLVRVYFEKASITGRDVAEAILCGVFVSVSRPVMSMIGINDDLALFAGAVVGYLGAKFLRPVIETLGQLATKRGPK